MAKIPKSKIMIVDDDARVCQEVKSHLEGLGYDIVTAPDGPAALALAESAEFDLVVLDIGMPTMDGLETLGKMLSMDNRLPVILNTAYPSYKDNFMSWAADAYVVKSSDLTELKEKIRESIARRK